ncbi:MAG: serine/threonine-protein phosphatase [Ruminococcus sp.]|nr:serine/threonine-protein phosphatase [Ruminococcus sp.]
MKYLLTATTSVGNYRNHNEDAILLGESVLLDGSRQRNIFPPFLCAVCDGVGGENAGEVASRMTAELLSVCEYKNTSELKNRIFEIHDKLVKAGDAKSEIFNMQTTLCLIMVDKQDNAFCLNVGDSRAYIFRDKTLTQITTDQSLAQYLTETGRAEKFDIDLKSYKNIIISSVGNPKQYPMIDLFSCGGKLTGEDLFILCSDGITDYISDDTFIEVSNSDLTLLDKQKKLIDSALEGGSKDNLSVVFVSLDEQTQKQNEQEKGNAENEK